MSDDNKKIEDMPLADLLGMGDDGPERVQDREDEPGSGIARLAQMVAASSVADAKRPSLVPPGPGLGTSPTSAVPSVAPPSNVGSVPAPASMPPAGSIPPPAGSVPPAGSIPPPAGSVPPPASSVPPTGSIPPAGSIPPDASTSAQAMAPTAAMPAMGGAAAPGMAPTAAMPAMGSAPATAAMPMTAGLSAYGQEAALDAPLPRKKPNIGIFAAIVVLVVAAGVSAFILLKADDEADAGDSEQLLALKSQLEELKTAKEKLAEAEKEAVKVAPEATGAEAGDEAAAAAAKTEKPAGEEAPKEMVIEEAAEHKPPTATKRGGKRGSGKRVAVRAPKKAAQPKAKASKKEEKPESELGSLLDGDVASGKKSPTGELPKTPSRADVKNAMRPVASRAAKCGKYSKGTVKLQITVASNGRVTQSNPVGGTANSTAGNCVAMIARTAKFPKFSNPTFTFNYPVKLK